MASNVQLSTPLNRTGWNPLETDYLPCSLESCFEVVCRENNLRKAPCFWSENVLAGKHTVCGRRMRRSTLHQMSSLRCSPLLLIRKSASAQSVTLPLEASMTCFVTDQENQETYSWTEWAQMEWSLLSLLQLSHWADVFIPVLFQIPFIPTEDTTVTTALPAKAPRWLPLSLRPRHLCPHPPSWQH